MAEFRDMMEQQMARSASVLYTIAGGGTASRADITEAMKTEFAYQVRTWSNNMRNDNRSTLTHIDKNNLARWRCNFYIFPFAARCQYFFIYFIQYHGRII